MSHAPLPTDPVTLVQSLDSKQIAARLEELAAEQDALRVLFRSARARERAQRQRQAKEAAHGSH
jgi:hypothetical protein